MSRISTHVLDTVLGKPGAAIAVRLEKQEYGQWREVSTCATDSDGRCQSLATNAATGLYRLTFATGAYLSSQARTSVYPEIAITFQCSGDTHYHLPLLLSDNSYTTYRGS